jgi:hypothetical protein
LLDCIKITIINRMETTNSINSAKVYIVYPSSRKKSPHKWGRHIIIKKFALKRNKNLLEKDTQCRMHSSFLSVADSGVAPMG